MLLSLSITFFCNINDWIRYVKVEYTFFPPVLLNNVGEIESIEGNRNISSAGYPSACLPGLDEQLYTSRLRYCQRRTSIKLFCNAAELHPPCKDWEAIHLNWRFFVCASFTTAPV